MLADSVCRRNTWKVGSSKESPSVRDSWSRGLITDVIKGDFQNDKAKLEALVHAHGGTYTQAQLSDLSAYVISPDDKSESFASKIRPTLLNVDVLVKAQKKKGISVVKPEWIYESIKRRVKL